jgi:hypothetical protein
MLSLFQRLGKLKYQARRVYQIKKDLVVLEGRLASKEVYLQQVQTVLDIQKREVEQFATNVEKEKEKHTLPLNLIYTCSEIERRETEWAEGRQWIDEHRKDYAYKAYQLQRIHNELLSLMESTQPEANRLGIPFDFPAVYQAVQETSHRVQG